MSADDAANNTGRNFFRIPLEDPGVATIKIDGKSFEVINLASTGVGIYLEDADTFTPEDNITDIELTIHDKTCHVVGRIVHVSPADINFLCGIELLNLNEEAESMLQGFVNQHKSSLFSFMPD